ncbi:MAG: antitoxin MazE-like protein [Rhizobium rhizophilum]
MGRPRELSQEERADLQRRGYRPIELWVPDLDNETMRAQLEEEARRIAEGEDQDDVTDWIQAVGPTDWDKS